MHKFVFFGFIEIAITDDDWTFLCKNRWFTEAPEFEDVQAEFVSGTGITPNKPCLWKSASHLFHNYVIELQGIMEYKK